LDRFDIAEWRRNISPEQKEEFIKRQAESRRILNPNITRKKDLTGERLRLIEETTDKIKTCLVNEGVSYGELARRLNMSPGHVSHLMSGTRNMTLATLADISEAIGYQLTTVLVKKEGSNG
jgi:hypothetical protein